VPDVFLLVGAEEVAGGGGYLVGHVADFDLGVFLSLSLVGGVGGGGVDLADCAGDDVDVQLAGERLVAREAGCGLGAGGDEVGVVGAPRG
jgi:hypothetical protein